MNGFIDTSYADEKTEDLDDYGRISWFIFRCWRIETLLFMEPTKIQQQ